MFEQVRTRLTVGLAVVALVIGATLTLAVQHLRTPSLSVMSEVVGTVGIVNFDGSKGCITVDARDFNRCGAFYSTTKVPLKAGDKVRAWLLHGEGLPNGSDIYLVVHAQ